MYGEPLPATTPDYDPRLTPEDIIQLDIIADRPDIYGPVLSAHLDDDGKLHVRTGQIYGPECGYGSFVTLRSEEGRWCVETVTHWLS